MAGLFICDLLSTSAANDSMGLHTQPYVITQIMYAETGRYSSVGM
jgi:hypothetical protein